MKRLLSAVSLVAAIAASLVAPAGVPASAQGIRLALAGQTPYVTADGEFVVELEWTGARNPEHLVSATIFLPVDDVDGLAAGPTEPRNRYPSAESPIAVTELQVTPEGNLIFPIPVRSFNQADNERVWLESPGVYPVTIEIRTAAGPVASIRTNLIRLHTETAEITTAPVTILLYVAAADGLELAETTDILERHPSLPVTVILEEGVLAQLATDTEFAQRFVDAVGRRAVTAVPALGLDPSALAAIGQSELYLSAMNETAFRFEAVGLEYDPTIIALETPITNGGSDLLTGLGVDTVIQLGPTPGNGTISRADQRTRNGTRLAIVEADDATMISLQSETFVASAAHEFLAKLSITPRSPAPPLVLGGPELRLMNLTTLEVLLDALDQPGVAESVPLERAIETGPTAPFRPTESSTQDLRSDAQQIDEILDLLGTYDLFYEGGGIAPATMATNLLASLSRDRNPDDRAAGLSRVSRDINSALAVIELPADQSITMAARERPIPLSIHNNSPGNRSVLLRFRSDRVDVAQHDQIVSIPPGTSAIEIDVVARSLGVSPLEVEVLSPDGRQVLASTQFQIRSTAIPGLGYLISGSALVFLMAWWIISATRSRAMAQHPAGQTTPDPARLVSATRDPAHNRRAEDRLADDTATSRDSASETGSADTGGGQP